MRTQKWLVLVLVVAGVAAVAVGCNKDPRALFVDMRWRAVCSASGGMCTSGAPSREVLGQDGHVNTGDPDGEDVNVSCQAIKNDGFITFDLDAEHSDYEIHLDNVRVSEDGGPNLNPGCVVEVVETINISGDLILEGACSSSDTDDAPCTVSAEVTRVEGDPTVRFTLSCVQITSLFDPGIYGDIVHGGLVTPTAPAELEVRNCPGL